MPDATPGYRFLGAKPLDPWPIVARDRERCPVGPHADFGLVQVVSHAALDEVLRDHETFSSRGTVSSHQEQILAFADPPVHTRQRRLLSAAFTPRRIDAATDDIQRMADDLADSLAGRDAFDVVEEFANPLVFGLITEMLGAPARDIARFRTWTKAAEANAFAPSEDQTAALREFRRYASGLVGARREASERGDDLLDALLDAEWDGERLDDVEIANILEFLLVAANSTTTDAVGNLVWALETHPEEKAKLLADVDGLIRPAIEEVLRYEGPIHALMRTVTRDTELEGYPIRAGQQVLNVYGACSHDPDAYDDPDRFVVDRDWSTLPHHFGFGWGLHYCLGASLARKEIEIAIRTLYGRFPGLRVVAGFEPEQVDAPFLRGWKHVQVQYDRPLRPRPAHGDHAGPSTDGER